MVPGSHRVAARDSSGGEEVSGAGRRAGTMEAPSASKTFSQGRAALGASVRVLAANAVAVGLAVLAEVVATDAPQ